MIHDRPVQGMRKHEDARLSMTYFDLEKLQAKSSCGLSLKIVSHTGVLCSACRYINCGELSALPIILAVMHSVSEG